jgi:hypothetical protein
MPAMLKDVTGLVLNWADSFSFALYLSWLYYFCGTMWMAFSYGYVKLASEERKWAKKFGYKFKDVYLQ